MITKTIPVICALLSFEVESFISRHCTQGLITRTKILPTHSRFKFHHPRNTFQGFHNSIVVAQSLESTIAVTLDKPILSFGTFDKMKKQNVFLDMCRNMFRVFCTDAFKTALFGFIIAFGFSFLWRPTNKFTYQSYLNSLSDSYKLLRGKTIRLLETFQSRWCPDWKARKGIPMKFAGEGGWDKSSLISKKPVGDSSYIQYEFQLPHTDNYIPLSLGQEIYLSCLNDKDEVASGGFHLFSDRRELGRFSILAPKVDGRIEKVEVELDKERADFAKVLDCELDVGDEVAVKPGVNNFSYRGGYLPITEMIYVASGMGIVPILHQIKAVLPAGLSTIEMVTVIWINENSNDFDIGFNELEEEYYKFNTKLEVSCIVDEGDGLNSTSMTSKIDEALPQFHSGTMVVISGSKRLKESMKYYLGEKGYPEECLCML